MSKHLESCVAVEYNLNQSYLKAHLAYITNGSKADGELLEYVAETL